MIQLPVDEAYAFDYLAILEVKRDAGLPTCQAMSQCATALQSQLGQSRFHAIVQSAEYLQMLTANRLTFERVEKAKTDACKASDVDAANHERYLAKQALQTRFFPEAVLQESKTERNYKR